MVNVLHVIQGVPRKCYLKKHWSLDVNIEFLQIFLLEMGGSQEWGRGANWQRGANPILWRPQGLTIIIKSLHMVTYMCQNFAVSDVRVQIPQSINQASFLLPGDFPNNFS